MTSQYETNLWSTHANIVWLAEPIRRCVRWRTQVFKIEGFVCKRFLPSPSPPPPPLSFFGSHFISRAAKTGLSLLRNQMETLATQATYSSKREQSNKRSGTGWKQRERLGRDALASHAPRACKARALRAAKTGLFLLRNQMETLATQATYSSKREQSNKRSGTGWKQRERLGRDALASHAPRACKARALRAAKTGLFLLRNQMETLATQATYSSKREQSNKRSGTGWKQRERLGRDALASHAHELVRFARFARARLLRHALPISLLILSKKTTVLQSTCNSIAICCL